MRRIPLSVVLVLLFLMTCLAFAQQPAAPPAKENAHAAKVAPGDQPPSLSETESLRLENLQLKSAMLQQQFNDSPPVRDLNQQFSAFAAALNREHPGWALNFQTRAFVKLTPPAKPASAAPEAKK